MLAANWGTIDNNNSTWGWEGGGGQGGGVNLPLFTNHPGLGKATPSHPVPSRPVP